jgi:hypothetical protein
MLKQEHVVRWNGLLRMLSSLQVSFSQVKDILHSRDRPKYLDLMGIEDSMAELIRFLEPFKDATLLMEKWTAPTLHQVFRTLNLLFNHHLQPNLVDREVDGLIIPKDSPGILQAKVVVFLRL